MKFLFLLLPTLAMGQATQPLTPAKALIPVVNGTDLATLKLLPNTTYLCAKGGTFYAGKQLLIVANSVTIDINGGTLKLENAHGDWTHGTIFNVLHASGFHLTNAANIVGGPEAVLLTVSGDHCAVDKCKSTNGLLKFAITATGGTNFNCIDNDIGITGSVSVFICTDRSIITGCNFRGSVGEYCVRYVADSDNKGNAIYVNGVLQRPQNATLSLCTIDNRGNSYGKQCVGFRAVDYVTCWGNTIYGSVRMGEPVPADGSAGKVTPTARCNFMAFHTNAFPMSATPAGVTNAVTVQGGVTGSVSLVTFQPPADTYSPVAVASNNSIVVNSCTQQFLAGQKIQPLIAPTSDKASYHDAGGNKVVVAPGK